MREGLRTFCCAALRVLNDLLEDLFIQHEIRDGFLKPSVLLLHVLKPLGLINLETAISLVGLFSVPMIVFDDFFWLSSFSHRPAFPFKS